MYYSYYTNEFAESRIYNAEFEENLDLTAEMFNISKHMYELLGSPPWVWQHDRGFMWTPREYGDCLLYTSDAADE